MKANIIAASLTAPHRAALASPFRYIASPLRGELRRLGLLDENAGRTSLGEDVLRVVRAEEDAMHDAPPTPVRPWVVSSKVAELGPDSAPVEVQVVLLGDGVYEVRMVVEETLSGGVRNQIAVALSRGPKGHWRNAYPLAPLVSACEEAVGREG